MSLSFVHPLGVWHITSFEASIVLNNFVLGNRRLSFLQAGNGFRRACSDSESAHALANDNIMMRFPSRNRIDSLRFEEYPCSIKHHSRDTVAAGSASHALKLSASYSLTLRFELHDCQSSCNTCAAEAVPVAAAQQAGVSQLFSLSFGLMGSGKLSAELKQSPTATQAAGPDSGTLRWTPDTLRLSGVGPGSLATRTRSSNGLFVTVPALYCL